MRPIRICRHCSLTSSKYSQHYMSCWLYIILCESVPEKSYYYIQTSYILLHTNILLIKNQVFKAMMLLLNLRDLQKHFFSGVKLVNFLCYLINEIVSDYPMHVGWYKSCTQADTILNNIQVWIVLLRDTLFIMYSSLKSWNENRRINNAYAFNSFFKAHLILFSVHCIRL